MKDLQPMNKHRAITRIHDAVSKLLLPPLAQLYQLFTDTKAGINKQRTELHQEIEETRIEAYSAATNLMTPDTGQLENISGSYFELIEHYRGK